MKRHPEHGLAIIRENNIKISDFALAVISQHHERYDGNGYPAGLDGSNIHEAALMGAVADVYDALTTDRVYREAWTPQKALATIFQGCDREYSRMVVERFTKHLGIYPVASFVRLTSGEMGVVTRVHPGRIMAPEVLVLFDSVGRRLEKPVTVDVSQRQNEPGGEKYRVEISIDPKLYSIRVADYLNIV
jgi:HD-GYP domain-containing protein (c-di-GMP phosphodiesterase class II)